MIHSGDSVTSKRVPFWNLALRAHIQAENATRERLNRKEQLQVPALRNILSTLIRIHIKTRPDSEVASGYSNEELISNIDDYDKLTEKQSIHLHASLTALPTTQLSNDELRNHIDKPFWYDFLRVAKNRQFYVTKKDTWAGSLRVRSLAIVYACSSVGQCPTLSVRTRTRSSMGGSFLEKPMSMGLGRTRRSKKISRGQSRSPSSD